MKAADGISDLHAIKGLLLSLAKRNRLNPDLVEHLLALAIHVLKELESASDWNEGDLMDLTRLKLFFSPQNVQMLIPDSD